VRTTIDTQEVGTKMTRVADTSGSSATVVPFNPGMQPNQVFKNIAASIPAPSKSVSTSSGGGGGGGSSSGGGGGGTGFSSGGQLGASIAPPMDSATFLAGDPTYQSQLAALSKALNDYRAQMQDSQNQYNVSYAGNTRDLGQQRGIGQVDLGNDYASRGLYESGLQAKAMGDLLDMFARRQSDLDTSKANFMSNTARDYGNFQSENNLSEQKAKQDALARAAAQLGVV